MAGGSVVFENKKMKVVSAAKAADGSKQDGQATYAPEEEITNSIIKGTFAISTNVVDKYFFVDFLGDSKLQIGTRKIKNEENEDIYVLRYTGCDENVLDVQIEADKEYTVEFEINQLTGKMNLTIEGAETKIKDLNVASNFTTFKGISFGSTKGAAIDIYVDNFAISSVFGPIDDVKAASKTALAAKLTSLASTDNISGVTDATAWAAVETAKATGDEAIDAAETAALADAAYKAAVEAINTAVDAVRSTAKASINTQLAAVTLDTYEKFATDYAAMSGDEQTAANNALAAIITKYTTAETGEIDKCKNVDAIKKAVAAFYNEVDKIFAVEVTYKYFTAASTEITGSSQKGLILKGGTPTIANVIALEGYKIKGIYTDETLTTEFTSEVSSSATIYVKVTRAVVVTFGNISSTGKVNDLVTIGAGCAFNNDATYVINGTTYKNYVKFGGNSGANKNRYVEIDLSSFEATQKFNLNLALGNTGNGRTLYVKKDIDVSAAQNSAAEGDLAAYTLADGNHMYTPDLELTGGAKYYLTVGADIRIVEISIEYK